ncbi:histidine kinase [Rhodococcus sp. BH2-1]|nr:histidine kinase [Rhodococcus sp. BH2-1]
MNIASLSQLARQSSWTMKTVGYRLLVVCSVLAGIIHGVPVSTPHRIVIIGSIGIFVGLGALAWGLHPLFPARHLGGAAIALLAAAGAVLTGWTSFGAIILGMATLCAVSLYGLAPSLAIAGSGTAVAALAGAVTGASQREALGAAVGGLIGVVVGIGRRARVERVLRDSELALARERAVLQHERADLLDERARLARELHDVLAHTLSALVVQLTAAKTVAEDSASTEAEVVTVVVRARRLATDGLNEARVAVRALRDEQVSPGEEIAALARVAGAVLTLEGAPRQMAPAPGLALVRAAQESLTNARKHAPGTRVEVLLSFDDDVTHLIVENQLVSGFSTMLSQSGGQFGLTGMRERLEQVGGELRAGPCADGWRVRAMVPA